MNLLRAAVVEKNGWWEMRLLDLQIVADGASESAMLAELEHQLIAHYLLARKNGDTPFLGLLLACPVDGEQRWANGDKNFRALNLPEEVRMALSAAFRFPRIIEQFKVDTARAA